MTNKVKRRVENIIIGYDQFMQVLLYLGNYTPDETISGIIGRKVKDNSVNWFEMLICRVLRLFQTKHCIKSIDNEETLDRDA